MDLTRAYVVGFLLVIVGIAMVLVGSLSSSSTSTGGAVFIGPFPIIFAGGPNGGLIALISLIAALAMLLAFYLSIVVGRKSKRHEPSQVSIHLKSRRGDRE